ncbi:MAG: heavy-metal-associated domain-containing protein [Ottowia sp.]|jgi:copper chaperone CopZ|uniref:heavy-metal-associated domain-containing protein n=1 Tax=Comamonadaceae TaxID=80864 RepID=UPI00023FCA87|nr:MULTISPECIES: heavy-metal-associated domain-containing protein [Comamonadaceae]EHL24168.1 putative cation-transporting ATPase transmembrane protein [Acidovorax sp. NO-1]MBP9523776.1 heavy-metal-associated domain-containing protein [Ottowia sp.]HRM52287.1 heavy-metal-associated domain-containing protein [Ottowia sp.]HRN05234.1 heavy-metal-associated domain-containing protein [Ottowia sp.]
MTTIDLAVSGMTCSMCVAHVTEALNGVAGVSAVEVSLKDGTARVQTSAPSADHLIQTLAQAGYPATRTSSGSSRLEPGRGGGCCCKQ